MSHKNKSLPELKLGASEFVGFWDDALPIEYEMDPLTEECRARLEAFGRGETDSVTITVGVDVVVDPPMSNGRVFTIIRSGQGDEEASE